ncbi:class F sortase [Candidatus Saccharibacteria bacterium]|nr:class F sortase [Candidatus Saccharibacteria bacterium]
MSLKINGWRWIVKWAIWSVVIVLFSVFLIKVMVFEANYYNEKEGSERVVAVEETNTQEEELIEEEPTEEEVREYTVAPDHPRYLTIEKLGIHNARILEMGVNTKGELDTPRNVFDVGWYNGSGKPGQGGTMIIDGHNGGPHVYGIFKRLPDLVNGDVITVERGDGVVYRYKVVENVSILLSEADSYMKTAGRSPEEGKESVTLITCTGEWSQTQGTYLSRQFTRAVLVEE